MEWGCNQQKLDMLSKNSCASAQEFMISWVYLRVFLAKNCLRPRSHWKHIWNPACHVWLHAQNRTPVPKCRCFCWVWFLVSPRLKLEYPWGWGWHQEDHFSYLGSNSFSRWLCATQLVFTISRRFWYPKCPIPCGLIIWGKSFKGSHHSVYDWLVKSWNMSLSKTSDPKPTVFYCVKSMSGQNPNGMYPHISTVSTNHHRGLIVFYVKVNTPNMRVTSPGTFEFFEERQRKVDLDTVFVVVHLGTSPHLIAGTGNCVGWRVSTRRWPPGNMRFAHSRSF